tara:strand:+ start:834 stop:1133 length:300 start_codon:yes stop_codon:yes gene_type:complete
MDIDKQMEEAHEIVDKASTFQVGGDHYKRLMIEPIDFIVQNDLPYALGNVIKYVCRSRDPKRRAFHVQDIKKAIHYLELHLEKCYEVDPQGKDLPMFED